MGEMMEVVNFGKLLLSLSILAFSSVFGWLLTYKIAGAEAGVEALAICLAIAGLTFVFQIAIYFAIQDRLFYIAMFYGAFGLNLVWFMFSLFMPIFWVDSVPLLAKYCASGILVFLCVVNIRRGFRQFADRWRSVGDPLVIGRVDAKLRTIDWERIQKRLRYDADIFIPGLPQNVTSVLSVLLVLSMLVGLNFRTVYPVFSVFAWGIPCAVFGSFFFQLIGNRMSEAKAINELQKKLGFVFTTGE